MEDLWRQMQCLEMELMLVPVFQLGSLGFPLVALGSLTQFPSYVWVHA